MAGLEIKDLHVNVAGKEILKGINLSVQQGEVHALMGPNGAGKSSLASVLIGSPAYEVTQGKILFRGKDLTDAAPEERAHAGLFMAFQYPLAIPGVSVMSFLRTAVNAQRQSRGEGAVSLKEFRLLLEEKMELLEVDRDFLQRYLNDGFSGGEKKRCEILQMAVLGPKIAIMDETDSGLDIDAMRTVASAVNAMRSPELGVLLITHYQRILDHIKPDFVHVMLAGKIVEEGGADLVPALEAKGYDWVRAKHQP